MREVWFLDDVPEGGSALGAGGRVNVRKGVGVAVGDYCCEGVGIAGGGEVKRGRG